MNPIFNLKEKLNQAKSVAEKYQLSIAIAELLERNKPKEALSFVEKAYWLAIQQNEATNKVDALILRANILKNISQYQEALSLLEKAEVIVKKIKYTIGKGLILTAQGFIAYRQGRQQEGIDNCEKAIKILEKSIHPKGIAKANANLAAVYFGIGDYEKAITYSFIAHDISLSLNDEMNRLIPYFNIVASYIHLERMEQGFPMITIGLECSKKAMNREIEANFYNLRGAYYFHIEDYEKANINWSESLKIRIEMESWDYVRMSMANLGSAFLSANQIDKALEMNNSILETINQTENPHVITTIYSTIAYTYTKEKDFENALINHQKALDFATRSGNKEHQRQANADISSVYEKMNDFENALIYYKKFKVLYDEIFQLEKEKIVLELEKKLKVKEQEAQLLTTKNKMLKLQKENSIIKTEKALLTSKVKDLEVQKRFQTNNNGIISLDKIICLEAFGQKTKIYLNNQTDALIETQILGELEIQLPKTQFFRIHKRYIINGYYLARKDSKRYTLKNGFKINTSRIYKPDLSAFLIKK